MIKVKIRDGHRHTYMYRKNLHQFGLRFIKSGKYSGYWQGQISNNDIVDIQNFCNKNKLKLIVYKKEYTRSHSYRVTFFKNNNGIKNGSFYICAYCGKILKKDVVTVDHVIAIDKVLRSNHKNFYRSLLKYLKITDINDYNNLVAACSKCNRHKSNKGGTWIVRGLVGKHISFWIFIYTLTIILFFILTGMMIGG